MKIFHWRIGCIGLSKPFLRSAAFALFVFSTLGHANAQFLECHKHFDVSFCEAVIEGKEFSRSEKAWAHFNSAMMMMEASNPDKAIRHLKKAVILDKFMASAYYHLGVLLLKKERPEQALWSLERAIRYYPEASQEAQNYMSLYSAHAWRGMAHEKLGRHEKALQDYYAFLKAPDTPVWDGKTLLPLVREGIERVKTKLHKKSRKEARGAQPKSRVGERKLVLRPDGIGGLDKNTTASIKALSRALPGFEIRKAEYCVEGECYPNFSAYRGGKHVLTIYKGEKYPIALVEIHVPGIPDVNGIQVGMTVAEIKKRGKNLFKKCNTWHEDNSEYADCEASNKITYTLHHKIFHKIGSSEILSSDELPPNARVTKIAQYF